MKRNIISKLLACVAAFVSAFSLVVATATANGIEWSYTVNDDKAEINSGADGLW